MPVSVSESNDQVFISYNERTICAVRYVDESIELFQISDSWRTQTTYPCQKRADSLWFYVIDSIDECVGEVRRLSAFEIEQVQTATLSSGALPNLVWDRDKRKMCELSKIAFLQILQIFSHKDIRIFIQNALFYIFSTFKTHYFTNFRLQKRTILQSNVWIY